MSVSGVDSQLEVLLSGKKKIAVACSGGSDSMALTLLAWDWAKKHKASMVALTVDHGLRKESMEEAKQVGNRLKKRGIPHTILHWEGKKPKSNLQENAREARYKLLTDYCKAQGIEHLLVAHTLEDQAETFLLRLRRGSGVDGLAAMAKTTIRDGIQILRPLLATRKSELLAYLKEKKQEYISDPSNENTAFDRVKIRRFLPQLAAIGISVDKLAKTAENMARARKYLRQETENFINTQCRIFPEGYATFTLPESDEIALRVLARLLMRIGCHDVPPRLDELERLYAHLKSPKFKTATLSGCIVKNGMSLLIFREPRAVDNPILITKEGTYAWDRFEISVPLAPRPLTLGPLTQQGWLELSRKYKLKNLYPDKRILYTLPALRDAGGHIIAVPHLGIGNSTYT